MQEADPRIEPYWAAEGARGNDLWGWRCIDCGAISLGYYGSADAAAMAGWAVHKVCRKGEVA